MRALRLFSAGTFFLLCLCAVDGATGQSPPATNYENSGVVSEMIGSDAAGLVAHINEVVASFTPDAQARVNAVAKQLRMQIEGDDIQFASTGLAFSSSSFPALKWIGTPAVAGKGSGLKLAQAIRRTGSSRHTVETLVQSVSGLIAGPVDATALVRAVKTFNAALDSSPAISNSESHGLHTIHGVLVMLVEAIDRNRHASQAHRVSVVSERLSPIRLPKDGQGLEVRAPLIIPGTTIATPTAYGARWGQVYGSVSSKPKILGRENWSDGTITLGMGMGNPGRWGALDITLNVLDSYSDFGNERALSVKFHRRLIGNVSAALGYENFWSRTEDRSEGGESIYGVISKVIKLGDHGESLRYLSLSVGAGSDRFLADSRFQKEERGIGFFASGAIQFFHFASMIANWTGQDLALGMSIRPSRHLPLTITPAFVDVTGRAREGARFSIGIATTYDFKR